MLLLGHCYSAFVFGSLYSDNFDYELFINRWKRGLGFYTDPCEKNKNKKTTKASFCLYGSQTDFFPQYLQMPSLLQANVSMFIPLAFSSGLWHHVVWVTNICVLDTVEETGKNRKCLESWKIAQVKVFLVWRWWGIGFGLFWDTFKDNFSKVLISCNDVKMSQIPELPSTWFGVQCAY